MAVDICYFLSLEAGKLVAMMYAFGVGRLGDGGAAELLIVAAPVCRVYATPFPLSHRGAPPGPTLLEDGNSAG